MTAAPVRNPFSTLLTACRHLERQPRSLVGATAAAVLQFASAHLDDSMRAALGACVRWTNGEADLVEVARAGEAAESPEGERRYDDAGSARSAVLMTCYAVPNARPDTSGGFAWAHRLPPGATVRPDPPGMTGAWAHGAFNTLVNLAASDEPVGAEDEARAQRTVELLEILQRRATGTP